MDNIIKGSSLTFSAQGGRGKEKNLAAAKISVRPSKRMAEGGCGGNSAILLQKIEASPAACSVRSRSQQKSFLFLLDEKIRRARNQKSEENFFAGWRAIASGGGAASFGWFRSGVFDKMSSSQTVKTHQTKRPAEAGLFVCILFTCLLCYLDVGAGVRRAGARGDAAGNFFNRIVGFGAAAGDRIKGDRGNKSWD